MVRAGHEGDVAAVSWLLRQTWHATYGGYRDAAVIDELSSRWHAPAVLAAELQDPQTIFLVAEVETRLCGHSALHVCRDDTAIMTRLYVDPSFQGQGIGRTLLTAAKAKLAGRACRIELEVERQNEPAKKFYARQGFVQVAKGCRQGAAYCADSEWMGLELAHAIEGGS